MQPTLAWSRAPDGLHAADDVHEILVAPSCQGPSSGWRVYRRPLGSRGPVASGDRLYRTEELALEGAERDPRWPAADDGPEAA